MWNFTRKRQSAGNICLVLFTAFLFTILVAPFAMVENAEAALTSVTQSGGQWVSGGTNRTVNSTSSGYNLLVELASTSPLTDFTSNLRIDFMNGNGTILSVYGNDTTKVTYTANSIYGAVYSLVYLAPHSFYISTDNVVYGKVYVGSEILYTIILTLTAPPPNIAPEGNVQVAEGASGSANLPANVTTVSLSSNSSLDVSTAVNSVAAGQVTVGGQARDLVNYTVYSAAGVPQQTVDLTQPIAVGGQNVQVAKAVQLESGQNGQPIVIANSDPGVQVSASIPDGTTVLAPAGWDGMIKPPAVVASGSVTGTAPSGYTVNTATVIKFGSDDVTLMFDQPVTIVLPNTTPLIGYKVPGSNDWITITQQAGGTYANPTPPAYPGEAYISNGTDTKIITWHATQFAKLNSTDGGGGGGGSITPVTPPPVVVTPFDDIATHWAKDDIQLLADKGIVKGMTATTFAPEATITRAQFATLLVKALGLTQVNPAKATFKDVKSGSWYYSTVETAAANGLVNGYKGSFNPDGKITRQEMAVMVAKALKVGGKSVSADAGQLDKFSDKQQIAGWAKDSVAVAVKEGIITGRTTSTFVPTADATRAEGTVMIKKVLGSLGKL